MLILLSLLSLVAGGPNQPTLNQDFAALAVQSFEGRTKKSLFYRVGCVCQDSIQFIKEYSQKKLGQKSQRVEVLYGGSVNEKNVEEFTNNKFIDGVFMGRSCLKVSNFIKICKRII